MQCLVGGINDVLDGFIFAIGLDGDPFAPAVSFDETVLDRRRPGAGFRHVLKKDDLTRFIRCLPDWQELSVGLNAVVLAPGNGWADGWHRPGIVAVCAWTVNLQFWKLVAEENNCFSKPFHFSNDHARFLFYRQPNPDRFYVPHEDYRCTVTVMSGLPGSGKDTWLAKNRHGLPVISLDDIRCELDVESTDNQGSVVQNAKERCRELLRSRTSFAFSATNLLRQTRQRWIDLFADYGSRIEIVYIEPPLSVILERNKRRERTVPEHVIRELAKKCEPPTWTETHNLVIAE